MIFSNRKTILHISFWCVYASFFLFQISSGRRIESTGWGVILIDFAFHIASMMILSYLNYFIFMPRLLSQKKILKYLLEFVPVFLVLMILVLWGKQYILDGWTHKFNYLYSFRFSFSVILSGFFLVVFVGLLKFVEDYFDLEAKKKELENEKLISELRFLKAQVNPHFLFNTLNNLYYLAFTQSPNTAEVVAKLSQMMRYMLYESNHNRVPIEKEIEYMKNYISLEKLRLNDEVPISFEVEGNTHGVTIAPMILITFLENAFKHGVSNGKKNSWIKAKLKVDVNSCTYFVSNSKIQESDKTVTEKSGIGLLNVKRRLELTYGVNYDLELNEDMESYSIKLNLDLT